MPRIKITSGRGGRPRESGGGSGGEIVVSLSNIGFLQPFFKWGASPSGKVWPLDFNGQIILAFCPISLKP